MPDPGNTHISTRRGDIRKRKMRKELVKKSIFVNTIQHIGFSYVDAVNMYETRIINFGDLKYNNNYININKLTLDGFTVNDVHILSRYNIPITFLNCTLSSTECVEFKHCEIKGCEISAECVEFKHSEIKGCVISAECVEFKHCEIEMSEISASQISVIKCSISRSDCFSDYYTSFIDCKLSNMYIESDDGLFESCVIYNSDIKLYERKTMSTSPDIEAINYEKKMNAIVYQYIESKDKCKDIEKEFNRYFNNIENNIHSIIKYIEQNNSLCCDIILYYSLLDIEDIEGREKKDLINSFCNNFCNNFCKDFFKEFTKNITDKYKTIIKEYINEALYEDDSISDVILDAINDMIKYGECDDTSDEFKDLAKSMYGFAIDAIITTIKNTPDIISKDYIISIFDEYNEWYLYMADAISNVDIKEDNFDGLLYTEYNFYYLETYYNLEIDTFSKAFEIYKNN